MITSLAFDHRPYQVLVANLQGSRCTFKYKWNTEGNFPTISIYNSAGEPIVQGIKLVMGLNALDSYLYKEEFLNVSLLLYRNDNSKAEPQQWEVGGAVGIVLIS